MVNFGDLGLEWGKIQLNKFQKSVHETGTYPSISSPHNLRLSDREVGDLSHLLHGRQGDASQARIHRIGMDRLPP